MNKLKNIIAFNFVLVFMFCAFVSLKAADTELYLPVNAGALTISASSTANFSAVNFSFDGQTSANNPLGSVNAEDKRGSRPGWSIDVTGEDWATSTLTMDYDGDGVNTGQLSLDIPEIGEVTANPKGDDTTGFTMGIDDSFSAATTTINFVTVSATNGSGDYWFADFNADQFIPGNQEAGTYNMTLTLTIS